MMTGDTNTPLVQLTGIDKRYGGVRALVGAEFSAVAGEVHGLLGPNGSGKSTLNKVLAGAVAADAGTVRIDGEEVRISSPLDAHRLGVGAAYQQLSVIPTLTVEQNLLLGQEDSRLGFLQGRKGTQRAAEMLERLRPAIGQGIRPDSRMGDLSPDQQQLVEIGKVLLRQPRILILDEATASLHRDQVQVLFSLVDELRREGICILFVSHRLEEITSLCDRATILRSGSTVATVTVDDVSPQELVRLMVGELAEEEGCSTPPPDSADVRLEVVDLSTSVLDKVSFTARRGEIIGLGGLQGQGQSDLLQAIFGGTSATGSVIVDGEPVRHPSPARSARRGIALVPGDRDGEGLFAQRPILENISLASMWRRAKVALSIATERRGARQMAERLDIRYGSLDDPVRSLSGGNAQKVVLAKWLLNEPIVILLDDPTKGVDVGAKHEFHRLIDELAEAGATVIINSSEDRELVRLCHRVLILSEGRLSGELAAAELSEERLVSAALRIDEGAQHED